MSTIETFVISAAGGNPTIIEIIDLPKTRQEYERRGQELMEKGKKLGVEQSASLILEKDGSIPHFEMSGGEFCGNAARSAALILSRKTGKDNVCFTMSGVEGFVYGTAFESEVSCEFLDLGKNIRKTNIPDMDAQIVDLGGIVHVVIFDTFPSEEYRKKHEGIRDKLGLQERDAVGVIWVHNKQERGIIAIHPVVWVRAIDTFFYETSCGSGSIAVAFAMGGMSLAITQPTGQKILVECDRQSVKLSSVMEVISHV